MVTVDHVRAIASSLPRSSEGFVRGQVKFRIGRIVWLALSRDGATMGFAFPKELRNALVEAEPNPAPERVRHAMAGNLCRCGAYPRIEEAVLTWRD